MLKRNLLNIVISSLFLCYVDGVSAQEALQDSLIIDEIVVTGARNEIDIRLLPVSVSVVNNQQIKESYQQSIMPIITEQVPSLFTTARGVMGYGVSTGSSGGIKVRGIGGSPTTGVLVLIDGHPQYMGLMGHSIADAYQSMISERIEIVRGPASMLYGSNAMGGVINILTKQNTTDGVENNLRLSYGSYNSLTSELSNRIKSGKFTSQVIGSYNRSDGHRENMEFEQYGGYAKVGYDFSDNWNLFADLSLTHYNASNPGTEDNPIYDNDSRITRAMTSLSLENNYAITSGALKLFYNWGEHIINDGYYSGGESQDYLFNSNDNMVGVSIYQGVELFDGNRITAGFDYQNFGGIAKNVYTDGTISDVTDKSESSVAAYLDFRQTIAQFLTLNGGLRIDDHSTTGTHFIPQFGASIRASERGSIKLITSRGFRNPTIKELYMFVSQNPDLEPESLWNYEVSWSQRLLNARLSYEVNLFYINGDNMIQTVAIDGKYTNVNTGAVENWGSEFSISYRLVNGFSFSSNYSYLNMKYPVVAAPEHKLYGGVSYSRGAWSASTGVQYIKGLYTSVSDTDTPQESYTLWNSRVSYQFSSLCGVFLKGENMLNQSYEINEGFPMPGATVVLGLDVKF
ncbi:MAG: TonB-dependent receptor [Rikenellaceae bacterium]